MFEAETEADTIAKHIRSGEFEGTTGALAVYQLTGKAAAELPLTPVEIKSLTKLTEAADLGTIIEQTEAHLIDVSGDPEILDALAEALGVPRPGTQPAVQSNLGASLVIGTAEDRG